MTDKTNELESTVDFRQELDTALNSKDANTLIDFQQKVTNAVKDQTSDEAVTSLTNLFDEASVAIDRLNKITSMENKVNQARTSVVSAETKSEASAIAGSGFNASVKEVPAREDKYANLFVDFALGGVEKITRNHGADSAAWFQQKGFEDSYGNAIDGDAAGYLLPSVPGSPITIGSLFSGLYNVARRVSIPFGRTYDVPVFSGNVVTRRLDSKSTSTQNVTEDNTATVNQIKLDPNMIATNYITITEKTLSGGGVYAVVSELNTLLGGALRKAVGDELMTGIGSGVNIQGLLRTLKSNSSRQTTSATAGSITLDEVVSLADVSSDYGDPSEMIYLMNTSTYQTIVGLSYNQGTTNPFVLFQEGVMRILGKRVVIDENVEDIRTGRFPVIAGFPQYYAVGEYPTGVRVNRLADGYAQQAVGGVGFSGNIYIDGRVIDVNAFKVLKVK